MGSTGWKGSQRPGPSALSQQENRELEPQLPERDFFTFCHFPTVFPFVTALHVFHPLQSQAGPEGGGGRGKTAPDEEFGG